MENITFNLETSHLYGPALFEYFKIRKTHFVNRLNWTIPHNDAVEMDQYDNPEAFYSLVRMNGRVVGGARIASTATHWGESTYMLRDASEGRLPAIPEGILPEIFETPDVWECTRLVIAEDITCGATRHEVLKQIVEGLVEIASDHQADRLISLSPVPLMRALRGFGHHVSRIGQTYKCDDDGRNYAVLQLTGLRSYVAQGQQDAIAA